MMFLIKVLFRFIVMITVVVAMLSCYDGDDTTSALDDNTNGDSTEESSPYPNLTDVSASQTGVGEITVTWNAATDDLTPKNEILYEVYLDKEENFNPGGADYFITVLGNTEAEITGLEVDKTYYVLVIAVDESGNQSQERDYVSITLSESFDEEQNAVGDNQNTAKIVRISDTSTPIGFIASVNNQQQFLTISGNKDANGNLTSVTDISMMDRNDPANNYLKLDLSDKSTPKVEFPNGYKAEFKNYDKATKKADVTIKRKKSNGDEEIVEETPNVTLPDMPDDFPNIPLPPKRVADDADDYGDAEIQKIKDFTQFAFGAIFGSGCKMAQTQLLSRIFIAPILCRMASKFGVQVEIKPIFCFPGHISTIGSIPLIATMCRNPFSISCAEAIGGILNMVKDSMNGKFCESDTSNDTGEPWIKLSIIGPSVIQPDGKLTLQISYYAPEGNARQILIVHYISVWGWDTIELSEEEGESGTQTRNFRNPLGNWDCENEKVIYAELYPGGWAVTPVLAKSNEIKAMWLCDR